ncbi:MAG: hypothetical protein M3Y76_00005, partial [Chloroflexota bacterium]|nr:hypothetical protein [Chloroflexota bacterium]
EQLLGRRATRLAVSVHDANYASLKSFIGNPEIEPLQMKDIGDILDDFLKFETEIISRDISTDITKNDSLLPIPTPPMASDSADVW